MPFFEEKKITDNLLLIFSRESAMVRRVNSRRGEVDRSPSVMTSNTGTGRRGHSGGDPRGEPRGAEVDRSPSVMQSSSGGLRERFVTPKYFFGNN